MLASSGQRLSLMFQAFYGDILHRTLPVHASFDYGTQLCFMTSLPWFYSCFHRSFIFCVFDVFSWHLVASVHGYLLCLNLGGRWGTTDDFATISLHFALFSTALWDLANLQACPFPDVVFRPLLLSVLSSSPFHCALQDGFGQTWWTEDMSIPLQFASFYDGQEVFVWSSCPLDHRCRNEWWIPVLYSSVCLFTEWEGEMVTWWPWPVFIGTFVLRGCHLVWCARL